MNNTYICFQEMITFGKKKIGGCFPFNGPKIEIIGEMPEGEIFDYLRPEGTIT